MNTKISLVFSIISIVAVVLLIAAGPIIATHQVSAWGGCDSGGCGDGAYYYGGGGYFYSWSGGYYYGGGGW
jgi:hypothetical protein